MLTHQYLKEMFPEGMAGCRGHKGITQKLVKGTIRHVRPAQRMAWRLQSDHNVIGRQVIIHRLQTLKIQINIEAAIVVENKVAHRIHPHDGLGIVVVDGQEPGVVLRQKGAIIGIGPQPVFPSRVMGQPALLIGGMAGRNLPLFPGLVDQLWNRLHNF